MPRRCAGVSIPASFELRIRSTADEVARRAFELYERRSAIDGWDLDEWIESDGEQIQGHASKAGGRS